jgi:hypothetical protein
MYLYILLGIVILILCIAAYIKIKFRFWSEQPVFHIYDFNYYLFQPGIINPELPVKNKYCNFKSIETYKYENTSLLNMNKFVQCICSNYLQNGGNQFRPLKNNIMPYFEGHNSSSFFSFYWEPELLTDVKTNTIVETKKLVGVMTTRPLHIVIKGSSSSSSSSSTFDAYYVDYLCVDKQYRKKGIAPQTIQTHHYNQRHGNRNISISLFKREGELTGIVPICIYNTYCFDMSRWIHVENLHASIKIVECGSTNIQYLTDFMTEFCPKKFDIYCISEFSNILELIKTKNIYIYMIIEEDEVECVYFFRKTCTIIDNERECISCFASICRPKYDLQTFIHGYKVALKKICENNPFYYAVLENISDNLIIVKNILVKTKPCIINPTAYFFYNYGCHSFKPKKVLIIC